MLTNRLMHRLSSNASSVTSNPPALKVQTGRSLFNCFSRRSFHLSEIQYGATRTFKNWTPSEVERLSELCAQGTPSGEIAIALDRSASSIYNRRGLLRRGDYKKKVHKWSSGEDETLLELDRAGEPISKIVKAFPNRTFNAVSARRTYLKYDNLSTTRTQPALWTAKEDRLLSKLHAENLPRQEIAMRLRRSVHSVRRRWEDVRPGPPNLRQATQRWWSADELEKLPQLKTQGYTDDIVASALCRSKAAIKSKLMTLKREQKDRSSVGHAWWTDEEIANLTDMKSRGLPLAAIAAAMPSRSARALAAKWLKIVRRLNQNEAEQGNP